MAKKAQGKGRQESETKKQRDRERGKREHETVKTVKGAALKLTRRALFEYPQLLRIRITPMPNAGQAGGGGWVGQLGVCVLPSPRRI